MTIARIGFVAGVLLAFGAHANPCKEDAEKLCKGVKPGGGRIIKCLKEHEADLSEACKAMEAKHKERAEEIHESCKADVDKLCKDVKPGRGRIIRCLRKHREEISDACKAAVKGGHKDKGAPAPEHHEED